jgi:5-methyltetrahydrofolate--homocysteine methyltransferase
MNILTALKERVLIIDGAMGTRIQERNLTAEDFDGLDGCNEYLVISRPDVIRDIHCSYYEVGADVVMTNTFGSSAHVLAEYDIGDRAYEISKKAAELAAEAKNKFSSASKPRYVSGSVGPGTRLPSLGHISFDDLHASLMPQMSGLIDGGVDLIQIETSQDLLQVKCAVIAARDAMLKSGRVVPIAVTITIETTGTMLVGSDVPAALSVLHSLEVDIIGLNCATGPDLMQEHLRLICQSTDRPVAVLPNAGLPRNVNGQAAYDLTPVELAVFHEKFVKEYGVNLVGGCCGTTQHHIAEMAKRLDGHKPVQRKVELATTVSSTFSAVPLTQDGGTLLIIGERCNANGSKKFKEYLLEENWDAIVEMGREEVAEGSHVLDICTAYVGRDEVRDMTEVLSRFTQHVTAPLMIDSTQLDVLEAGLKLLGGRAVINSINLEDGEDKFDQICILAKRYGAALIALTIDEEGMAKTAQRKLEVAKRIYDLCTKRHGIPGDAIIFDPLTFTLASGDEDSRKAGIDTLDAIALIKSELVETRTILGLSNISFGLKPYPRQILNSVFLAEAQKRGLVSAIVHSKKILPINQIDPACVKIALDLIYDRRSEGYDPLFEYISLLQGAVAPDTATLDVDAPIEERLKKRIIDGRKTGIETDLDLAMEKYTPLEIINTVLLEGMKVVGELFGSGEMQLPFVLQSAETMKKAVSYLEKFMDKSGGPSKGCMVLATVRGDVHDIGKNLVDIILSNNGYKVVNLGIKQPIEAILAATEEHKPDAIGMSGLLVKSTLVMKENLEEMTKRELSVPVICGGAALTRAYVEVDLRKAYPTGQVFYGSDAFAGLQMMDELTGQVAEKTLTGNIDPASKRLAEMRVEREERVGIKVNEVTPAHCPAAKEIPTPPFWGSKVIQASDIDLREVFKYINKKALYSNQWMYRRGSKSTKEHRDFVATYVEEKFKYWCEKAIEMKWLEPAVVYGYYPVQSQGNSILVFDPEDHSKELVRIALPRQTIDNRRCLADYFSSVESGRMDVVAFHVVTAGAKASQMCQELFKADDYSDYLHFYGLSVETAEAMAEFWHHRIRKELGINKEDSPEISGFFRQQYQGERYSFGYPACPNLEDQKYLFQLLKPERIGVELSEEFQLHPEQSTSAIVCHHPDACYFALG